MCSYLSAPTQVCVKSFGNEKFLVLVIVHYPMLFLCLNAQQIFLDSTSISLYSALELISTHFPEGNYTKALFHALVLFLKK
jgi:hypothetical protein